MAKHVKTTSTHVDTGSIRYMNGSCLNRPLDLPTGKRPVVIIFAVLALIIGIYLSVTLVDSLVNGKSKEISSVEQIISQPVTQNIPVLTSFMPLDDTTIDADLQTYGSILDIESITHAKDTTIDSIKLSSQMPLTDAITLYTKGLTNISSTDAARFLNGSWRLVVARNGAVDMKLKYADFNSNTADTAISTAMQSQGFTAAEVTSSGTDSSNNTYKTGTTIVDGETYTWQIYVCPLSDIYKVDGFPDTAQYVGIHLT
ncbi:MAG: hypothetical protein LKF61_03460 [Eggerthellaceae bacterium]|jgi:hypothetical protein|nr:hypothetical protein [Eggerthellaceae bacterium]